MSALDMSALDISAFVVSAFVVSAFVVSAFTVSAFTVSAAEAGETANIVASAAATVASEIVRVMGGSPVCRGPPAPLRPVLPTVP